MMIENTVPIQVYPDGRISRAEAAKYVGVAPATLRTWNARGTNDEFFTKIVIASKVYYSFEKVQAFCRLGTS